MVFRSNLIQAFEVAQGCIISHRVRGKVHFETDAQEGALKCEIRACHFVRSPIFGKKKSIFEIIPMTF